jgi:hypothetical protein
MYISCPFFDLEKYYAKIMKLNELQLIPSTIMVHWRPAIGQILKTYSETRGPYICTYFTSITRERFQSDYNYSQVSITP